MTAGWHKDRTSQGTLGMSCDDARTKLEVKVVQQAKFLSSAARWARLYGLTDKTGCDEGMMGRNRRTKVM